MSVRLTPDELGRLRTLVPYAIGVGTWTRTFILTYEAEVRARRMDTAREFLELVDSGTEWEITCDDGMPPDVALTAIRDGVSHDDPGRLPYGFTVRLRAGEWRGLLLGEPALYLEDMHD